VSPATLHILCGFPFPAQQICSPHSTPDLANQV
jgi:hypothetical protein